MCQACIYVSFHQKLLRCYWRHRCRKPKVQKEMLRTDLFSIKMCLLNQTDSDNIMFTSSEREFVSPDQHLRKFT